MINYNELTLAEARRAYLNSSTAAMPLAGLLCWGALTALAFVLRDTLQPWMVFLAAAAPFPLALLIDKVRRAKGLSIESRRNPITQLFMRFIFVIALFIPFVVIGSIAAMQMSLLVLGMALLAGMIWVPHGWGADDPAGLIHFVVRAALCYAAYFLTPPPYGPAVIAAAAAMTYIYAIAAMKKPESVSRD